MLHLVFLSIFILCFRGVKQMVRLKWAAYAVIFIFIENLVRIISSYPIVHTWEVSTWEKYHYLWCNTGKYSLIMSIFTETLDQKINSIIAAPSNTKQAIIFKNAYIRKSGFSSCLK